MHDSDGIRSRETFRLKNKNEFRHILSTGGAGNPKNKSRLKLTCERQLNHTSYNTMFLVRGEVKLQ